MEATAFDGLDPLTTAVIALDQDLHIAYANPAAENLLELSKNTIIGLSLDDVFTGPGAEMLASALDHALEKNCIHSEHDVPLATPHGKLQVSCTVTPVEMPFAQVFIELRKLDQHAKLMREEHMLDQSQVSRELIRNLAHEIKNPLGGIRGAAQLLARELGQPKFKEYTKVIIAEADRLQSLVDRLLAPHRLPRITDTNIHEVLERVRSLLLAEFPLGIGLRCDYDVSLPQFSGDKEQLIQAVLNIARNAAEAMHGTGEIILRTRIARQITIARQLHRHAVMVQIIDNGPGIPEAIRDKIFFPLISGREGGSGLGLTLAQAFINQHHGAIEVESRPGYTCFTLLLPVNSDVRTEKWVMNGRH